MRCTISLYSNNLMSPKYPYPYMTETSGIILIVFIPMQEFIEKILVVNPPKIMSALWKIIQVRP